MATRALARSHPYRMRAESTEWNRPLSVAAEGLERIGRLLCEPPVLAYSRSMSEQIEDSALMLRYKDGDVAAFEVLYKRHKDSLHRYLFRLCKNRDTAEDLYQEVWKKIIDSRKRYRPTAMFTTFLYRVAHNSFIDYVRRNSRYSSGENYDADRDESVADPPEVAADKQIFRRRFEFALLALPDEQRDAFLLHEEAGLGLDAIAGITGASRETVKSRLRYANNKLKNSLVASSQPVRAGKNSGP